MIYVHLELSDLTDAIKALYEYLQHTPASGSMKSGKSFSSSKSGKVSLLSRGMQSGRNNALPVQMLATTGANLVKSAKSSGASRRIQLPKKWMQSNLRLILLDLSVLLYPACVAILSVQLHLLCPLKSL